ncbi:MAG TPA: TIM barrel protein [Bryobacterales bacterium]|nr:TIM barrel protein [Bryobacterales bacterium]
MSDPLTRRRFTAGALLGAAGSTLGARGPAGPPRPGERPPRHAPGAAPEPLRLRLGTDAYSFRATHWEALEALDYAAKIGLDSLQFSEFPEIARSREKATDPQYLKQVRARASALGIQLEMGAACVCPTSRAFHPAWGTAEEQLALAIRCASILGARVVRCVVGNQVERAENGPIERHIDAMVRVCRAVRRQALEAGVKIAIENHKDLRAEEMRRLIEQAGPDYVGSCLDTGNPIWVVEDPLQTVEILAPYSVTSHFRDTAIWRDPRGAAFTWVAMGEGSVGIDHVVREFARRAPHATFNLEIITGRPPAILNYLEPEFWKPFEKVKAGDFGRVVALAAGGRPYRAARMAPNDPDQQRADLERSVKYCRETLGVRWRA